MKTKNHNLLDDLRTMGKNFHLTSIEKIFSATISSANTVRESTERKVRSVSGMPDVSVRLEMGVHDTPPPYVLSDEEYDTLSHGELKKRAARPIVLVYTCYLAKSFVAVIHAQSLQVEEFSAIKTSKAINKLLDNPSSHVWLRLLWIAHEGFGVRDIAHMDEDFGDIGGDYDDPADAWKKGKRPE